MGVDNELVLKITRAADKTMAAAQEWKLRAEVAEARVAVLEKCLAEWKARAGRMALRAKPIFDKGGKVGS